MQNFGTRALALKLLLLLALVPMLSISTQAGDFEDLERDGYIAISPTKPFVTLDEAAEVSKLFSRIHGNKIWERSLGTGKGHCFFIKIAKGQIDERFVTTTDNPQELFNFPFILQTLSIRMAKFLGLSENSVMECTLQDCTRRPNNKGYVSILFHRDSDYFAEYDYICTFCVDVRNFKPHCFQIGDCQNSRIPEVVKEIPVEVGSGWIVHESKHRKLEHSATKLRYNVDATRKIVTFRFAGPKTASMLPTKGMVNANTFFENYASKYPAHGTLESDPMEPYPLLEFNRAPSEEENINQDTKGEVADGLKGRTK